MATHCYVPVLGRRIRATTLTEAGEVGTDAMALATDGFISVNLSAEIESGTEILVRNASGAICVNEKRADSFKRFTVEIEFCGVNPSLLTMLTNAEPYEDAEGDVAGFTVPEGEIDKYFSLELWTGLTGSAASGYMLLPFVTAGVLGDITVDGENAVTFSMTGAATRGGNGWGVGPYDVVGSDSASAGPLPSAIDSFDHLLMIDTAVAPPPSACDPFEVMA